jgi:hypothetical protein
MIYTATDAAERFSKKYRENGKGKPFIQGSKNLAQLNFPFSIHFSPDHVQLPL